MRVAQALLALAVISASVLAQEPGKVAVESYTLANGLKVHLVEDHSSQVVAVDVWYDVGARNERAGRTGFAHLFEHMMFQGSANVKKAEHFQFVEKAGGFLNGSTTIDRTNYFEVLPSNRLNLGLWLESDRMRSLAITQPNLDNQREAVKEERYARLMELTARISAQKLAAKVGRVLPVIIDEVGEPDEDGDIGATGRSQADAPEIDGNVFLRNVPAALQPGQVVQACVEQADEHDLYGYIARK